VRGRRIIKKPSDPVRLHKRTREPGAEYVYKQCLKMWQKRGWVGETNTFGAYREYSRGLITFSCMKGLTDKAHLFTVVVESGTYSVRMQGEDYIWVGKVGLPKIPDEDAMIEIRLAV
jgi:hypothetical protein